MELRERNGEVWVLTARLAAELLACDSPLNDPANFCAAPYYEAVLLHGFRPNGASLEPIGQAELPFEGRSWWGGDGVVTALGDGSLHVVRWGGSGALSSVSTLQPDGRSDVAGPADVVGNELSVVGLKQEEMSLDVYDLDSGAPVPVRSSALGPRSALGLRTVHPSGYSLFAQGHLWLQPQSGFGDAQVWDLTGDTPVRSPLPLALGAIVPIAGAAGNGQTDELLALGWARDAITGDSTHLLSIRGSELSVLDEPGLDLTSISLYGNLGQGVPAPASLQSTSDAVERVLRVRGTGLPIGVDPEPPSIYDSDTRAFVAVDPDGGLREGAALGDPDVTEVSLVQGFDSSRRQGWRLDLTHAGSTQTFELSANTLRLIPTGTGVVAVGTAPIGKCQESLADCPRYAPGVSVFDFSGAPRRVASLAYPELPLPQPSDPNRLTVNWYAYDLPGEKLPTALELSERRLAFVAQVNLTCGTRQLCDAFGIEAVSYAEAYVGGDPEPCLPVEVDPNCATTQSVYGTGQRQYFYVLDLDAAGGPAWESWGESRLVATARRSDHDSHFAAPFATDGVLATTRLERRSSATDPSDPGATRFFLDRFERSASGSVVALPPVNVPGRAVAKLGGDSARERWLSVEAAPGETGEARLYRLDIRSDGARIERQLDLGGDFADFRMLSSDTGAPLGLALLTAKNPCGTSQLSTVRLGTSGGDADEPLEVAGTLELPSDGWRTAAVDRDLVLLRRDSVYVLVRVGADRGLSVVSSRAADITPGSEQLLGMNLFGAAGYLGHRSVDLSPRP